MLPQEEQIALAPLQKALDALVASAVCIDAKAAAQIQDIEDPVTLVLLNKAQYQELLLLERQISSMMTELNPNRKRPFFSFGKIISREYPAYRYAIKAKHDYKNINSPTKVRERIEETHQVWVNTEKKRLTSYIEETDWESEADKLAYEKERLALIEEQELQYEEILSHYDEYHVVISNFEDHLVYPYLYYTLTQGENNSKSTMLRQSVPNFLYYEEDIMRAASRSDKEILKVVKEYDKICSTIYFKKKEGSDEV